MRAYTSGFELAAVVAVFMTVTPTRASGIKIGVINTEQILRDSAAAEKARADLLDDLKDKRVVFSKKQREVRVLEEGLRDNAKKMTASKRKEKVDTLSKELKNLKRLKEDLEEELKKKNLELTRKILKEVGGVVKEYFEREDFTLILERKSVVISADSIDITKKIIELYDAKKK
jgi:outer membrane protein